MYVLFSEPRIRYPHIEDQYLRYRQVNNGRKSCSATQTAPPSSAFMPFSTTLSFESSVGRGVRQVFRMCKVARSGSFSSVKNRLCRERASLRPLPNPNPSLPLLLLCCSKEAEKTLDNMAAMCMGCCCSYSHIALASSWVKTVLLQHTYLPRLMTLPTAHRWTIVYNRHSTPPLALLLHLLLLLLIIIN